jgi:hypothetical protein
MSIENLSDCGLEEIFKQKIGKSCTENTEIFFEGFAMVILKSHTTLDALGDLWNEIKILENEVGLKFEKLIENSEGFYAVMTKSG